MILILQIETATTSCSVGLSKDGETIALKELNERNVHASSLTLFIEEVVQQSGYPLSALNAVAVSKGPGSYTGLRIGVSVAKGLCYGLDIPLIAIDTLQAMAAAMRNKHQEEALFCPMIDARRMEVYTALFDSKLTMVSPVVAKIIDPDSFSEFLKEKQLVFFGDGADKCEAILGSHSNALFEKEFINSAADMSKLSYEKFISWQFEDTAYFEPFYLKDFIAGKPAASHTS